MRKLSAVIIDDEPLAHEIIMDYAAELPSIEIIAQFYHPLQALEYLSQNQMDVLFLDINMPGLSGMELIRILPYRAQVILTSAHRQYAVDSYELDVCDYLLKPFRFERFVRAVSKAQQQLHLQYTMVESKRHVQTGQDQNEKTRLLIIKVDKSFVQLNCQNILYLQAYGNYVKVHTTDKTYLTARTLQSLESELLGLSESLVRIHKSYIVNTTHIAAVTSQNVLMNNQQNLPIGKNFRKLAKNLLSNRKTT